MRADEPNVEQMTRLWVAMVSIYGQSWIAHRGTLPIDDSGDLTLAGRMWASGLRGIDDAGIRTGIGACMSSGREWPPALPAFRALCMAIPTLAQCKLAMRDADAPPSQFVLLVWSMLDRSRYQAADARGADRMLEDAHELAAQHVMAGGALPVLRHGIGHEVRAREVLPADVNRQRVEDVLQELRTGRVTVDAEPGA